MWNWIKSVFAVPDFDLSAAFPVLTCSRCGMRCVSGEEGLLWFQKPTGAEDWANHTTMHHRCEGEGPQEWLDLYLPKFDTTIKEFQDARQKDA